MGATNPANAEDGTIRKKWASSIEYNAIHGSDAEDTARFELSYFFAGYELSRSKGTHSCRWCRSRCCLDELPIKKRKIAQRITDVLVEEAGSEARGDHDRVSWRRRRKRIMRRVGF